jgi:hypothetical protein
MFSRRKLLTGVVIVLLLYAIVCLDVVLRARHAYLEGEHAPSAQLAYAWYESASTLFTPPESRWSRLAREKMPIAKEKWKAELKAKNIHFNDSMLD